MDAIRPAAARRRMRVRACFFIGIGSACGILQQKTPGSGGYPKPEAWSLKPEAGKVY
jgi:hypothetical protein